MAAFTYRIAPDRIAFCYQIHSNSKIQKNLRGSSQIWACGNDNCPNKKKRRANSGATDPKDHAFTLQLFTCEFDELFPDASPVLLPQTLVHSIAQPVLSPTPGATLWKQSYKFQPWFAFTVFLFPWKRRAQSMWMTPSMTITQWMRPWLSLSKKSCQLYGNVCWIDFCCLWFDYHLVKSRKCRLESPLTMALFSPVYLQNHLCPSFDCEDLVNKNASLCLTLVVYINKACRNTY